MSNNSSTKPGKNRRRSKRESGCEIGGDSAACRKRHKDGKFQPGWRATQRCLDDDQKKYLEKNMTEDVRYIINGGKLRTNDIVWFAEGLQHLRGGGNRGEWRSCGLWLHDFNAGNKALGKQWANITRINIPVNVKKKHFHAIVIGPQNRKIWYYDSRTRYGNRNGENISGDVSDLNIDEWQQKFRGLSEQVRASLMDVHCKCLALDKAAGRHVPIRWRFEVVNDFIYQQNDIDCGVFVCLLFDVLATGMNVLPPGGGQDGKMDIGYMRPWIAYTIRLAQKKQGKKNKLVNDSNKDEAINVDDNEGT